MKCLRQGCLPGGSTLFYDTLPISEEEKVRLALFTQAIQGRSGINFVRICALIVHYCNGETNLRMSIRSDLGINRNYLRKRIWIRFTTGFLSTAQIVRKHLNFEIATVLGVHELPKSVEGLISRDSIFRICEEEISQLIELAYYAVLCSGARLITQSLYDHAHTGSGTKIQLAHLDIAPNAYVAVLRLGWTWTEAKLPRNADAIGQMRFALPKLMGLDRVPDLLLLSMANIPPLETGGLTTEAQQLFWTLLTQRLQQNSRGITIDTIMQVLVAKKQNVSLDFVNRLFQGRIRWFPVEGLYVIGKLMGFSITQVILDSLTIS